MLRKTAIIFLLLILIILTGCHHKKSNDKNITEENAKQIVIDERSRTCCDAEVVSIISKPDKYIIQWEIDSIEEKGRDSIQKKTGKIKMIESSRGTCKIK